MARHGQPLSVHLFLAFWLAAKVASLSLSLCLFVCLTLSLSFFRQGYGAGDFCLSLSLSLSLLCSGVERLADPTPRWFHGTGEVLLRCR